MTPEPTVWGIHAGRDGEADTLFMSGAIAVGWERIGDLSTFTDRTALKAEVKAKYPEKKPNAIPGLAGVLYRLAKEMSIGDFVVYPRKDEGTVAIGRVIGPYKFGPQAIEKWSHQRPVEWLKEVPRLNFSLGARQEIGSALTMFRVKTYAEEFLAALQGTTKPTKSPEFVGAELATESTEEYVRKRISEKLKGKPFEQLVAHMFRVMGYHAVLDPEGPTGPYDIRAGKGLLGVEPPLLKIECKSAEEAQANQKDIMQLAHISAQSGHHGVFVSLAGFRKDAEPKFGGSPVTLVDGVRFVRLFLRLYRRLSLRYRRLIPLRNVWVPAYVPAAKGEDWDEEMAMDAMELPDEEEHDASELGDADADDQALGL